MDGDARDAPGSLPLLPWVPDAVAYAARALYADAVRRHDNQYLEVLKRLVTDCRMQPAWAQLLKRRRKQYRSTEPFFHPAKPVWDIPDNTLERQHRAIGSLLFLAVNLAVDSARVMTRREVETVRRKALDDASKLRDVAKFLSPPDPALEAADAREREAALWGAAYSGPLVVQRDMGDARARYFVILFASQCRQLFGSPLYGLTATVASVALGRQLTPRPVRQWVSTTGDLCG